MTPLPAGLWREPTKPGPHALKDGAEFRASKSTSAGRDPLLQTPVQHQQPLMHRVGGKGPGEEGGLAGGGR